MSWRGSFRDGDEVLIFEEGNPRWQNVEGVVMDQEVMHTGTGTPRHVTVKLDPPHNGFMVGGFLPEHLTVIKRKDQNP